MGIGGHMLGPRKLRKLNRETGMEFDRAFNRDGVGGARLLDENGECRHYWINFRTMEIELVLNASHWSSCRDRMVD